MTEFLTKQIINRVHFKFQRSDFPPSGSFDDTIVDIVADTTLRYYHFENFTNLRLNNLRLPKVFLYDKKDLLHFGEEQRRGKPQGKLIHVRFKDGKPEFNEETTSDQSPSSSPSQTNQSL